MVAVATCIYNGVVRTDAYQCVDVSVGVVADEASVLQPDHALGTQILLQTIVYLLLG